MITLHHAKLSAPARAARLVCGEYGAEVELVEQRPWERRETFLALDPAGQTPVLVEDGGLVVPGPAVIAEWLDETAGATGPERRLMPSEPAARVEVRRLTGWFLGKFYEEVTGYLVNEKIYKRFVSPAAGGGPPDMASIRAARANVRYHMRYIGFLAQRRNFLAGDALT